MKQQRPPKNYLRDAVVKVGRTLISYDEIAPDGRRETFRARTEVVAARAMWRKACKGDVQAFKLINEVAYAPKTAENEKIQAIVQNNFDSLPRYMSAEDRVEELRKIMRGAKQQVITDERTNAEDAEVVSPD